MTRAIPTCQFWIRAPGDGVLVEKSISGPDGDELLVETRYSGISRGTESLVFRGEVPESQYHEMRAPFQEGEFPGPLKYGYSSVGRVASAPESHRFLEGKAVFCLFPHQDRYVVPASAVVPLPEGVPEERGVLAANMETAVNIVWDAGPSVGDRVVVVGGGVVGMLVAWLCQGIPGGKVRLIDIDPGREPVAEALDVPFASQDPGAGDADVVVHASGSPEGLSTALAAAGSEARIVEASWFGSRTVPLPLGEAFHSRRLTLRSSQVGAIPPERAPRWTHRRRLAVALDLLVDPRLDVLISGESPFSELPDVMRRLSEEPSGTLCHRIRYRDADARLL
ncbi:MAG: zinc-binding alcohol dehydrogenase [Gemmatimonadota bacterium]